MFTISYRKVIPFCCLILLLFTSYCFSAAKDGIAVGVYYYPGWKVRAAWMTKDPWDYIKPFKEKEPLLGYYPEGETWVAEKHIEWASMYGIDFIAYEWYWDKDKVFLEHALQAHLKAKNKGKLRFSLLWANGNKNPDNLDNFDKMVNHWIENFFNQPTLYRIDGKPVVFIFRPDELQKLARSWRTRPVELLTRAREKAVLGGHKGIYFVALTNGRPNNSIEKYFLEQGYDAYTGWNYVVSEGKSKVAAYDSMVDTYIHFYEAASKTAKSLPYIVPVSPGWDVRPWKGEDARVRENPTPEKFKRMLEGAKKLLDSPKTSPKILMIQEWNDFPEGAYIEPTKKWGFRYLEVIREVFAR